MTSEEWADPGSLLGRLRRGRGLGHREAIATVGAETLVLECLRHEPRWDPQVDERGEYYARLVLRLGIPVHAIPFDRDDPDVTRGVPFEVLVALASEGSAAAAAVLHTYFESADEPDWGAVDDVWRDGGPAARDGLVDVVLGRIGDADLAAVVTRFEGGPWAAWAEHPRVAVALAREVREPWRRPDLGDRTTAELHDIALGPVTGERRWASDELARRGDLILLDLAERTDLRDGNGAMPWLGSSVVRLGGAALPRARAWARGDDEWLRHLGRRVVGAHGTAADADDVLAWFEAAVSVEDWCATEGFAECLGRLRHVPSAVPIRHAWEVTPHSLARTRYLPALVAIDGGASEVDEAVDDCESLTRRAARAAMKRVSSGG
ncbi:hypothetical protein ACFO3K_13430 [Cellulomonas algicola]|uniref:hypothetical protein n=1 Tax=Cellulomonas algicola TaxID=2071633 RepID=UPI001C3F543D|nr:hypothetical protein [Cellulomonas algicola]